MSAGIVEQAIRRVAVDPSLRLAFAAPAGARWLLPLYELALLSAAALRDHGVAEPDIVVATGEHEPLEVFGPAVSEAIRRELDRAGVELVTSARGRRAFDGARSGSRAATCSTPTSSWRYPSWSAPASPGCRTTTTGSSPSTSTAAFIGMHRRLRRRRRDRVPGQARRPRRPAGRRGRRGDRARRSAPSARPSRPARAARRCC